MQITNWRRYLVPCISFIILCFVISGFASWVTANNITHWYVHLNKPVFTPPSWLFGPVWSVLYVMIGIAGGILWVNREVLKKSFCYYLAQLLLNFSWSFVFFGAKKLDVALVIILLIVCLTLLTIIFSWKAKRIIGYLLLPYLLWVSFASILNFSIMFLN